MNGTPPDPADPPHTVVSAGPYRLRVFDFGLACCAIEFVAATIGDYDFSALGSVAAGPPEADVLVVSGTLTDKMAPAVRRLYERLPKPRYVISFGSCANTGGPYWDSYCVTKGVDQLIPVDVYVPGCPPRPEALVDGLARLRERIAGGPAEGAPRSGVRDGTGPGVRPEEVRP